MIQFEELAQKVEGWHPQADLRLLQKAYAFSEEKHQGQVRRSGDPFLSHPVEVANILAEMRLDVASVSVGLLHDVVEDTLATLEDIRESFGDDVAHLVDGVTKISRIQFPSPQHHQAENYRKLLLAMVDDLRVILVKLADRLHNMRTLEFLPKDKRKTVARETMDIYAPIAHRLGMAKMRGELEDLAFQYLEPEAYQNIVSQVELRREASDRFICTVVEAMEQRFEEAGLEAKFESRIKRFYSIFNKISTQKIGISQVYDFIAVRVLVNSVADCYTVLGIVNNMWTPVPARIKDFIAVPRQNMYQSLHTTVVGPDGQPFEIQIRTHEMHQIAEEGIAAHWKYKEGKLTEDNEDSRFQWLRRLLEWQREVSDPRQFLSNLKIDLYPDEVYLFTPKGEVITLPQGSTPVDFAYAIHTEVGNKCIGAKVDGRIVPLKFRLKNGGIVEIMTSAQERPSRDWISFVKTSKARSAIRRWINLRQRKEAVELGQKMVESEGHKIGLSLRKLKKKAEGSLESFNVKNFDELMAAVGYGRLSARSLLRRVLPDQMDETGKPGGSRLVSALRRVLHRTDTIKVKGETDLLVFRAKCCNPIRGEEIVGYVTVGRGISVHSASCPNVENLLSNPERTVEVLWSDEDEEDLYVVGLSIHSDNKPGMLAAVTAAISAMDTNIIGAQAAAVDGEYGIIEVTIEVRNTTQLDRIIGQVRGIPGVRDVIRHGREPQRART